MKQKMFLLALAGVAFAACSNHDDYFAGKTMQEAKYEQSFITRFGQPSSNHTWGFGPVTRATRSAIDVTKDGAWDHDDAKGNEWYKYVNVPQPVTESESQYVYEYFKKYKGEGISVNWQRFFVQQVWKGTEPLRDGNGTIRTDLSNNMNYLLAGPDYEHMSEIKNFNSGNAGNQTCYYDEHTNIPQGIAFHLNSSTKCFAYHNSLDNNNDFYDNFLMLEIDVPGVGVGYYVGFDFESNGTDLDKQVERDYEYVDWIVKVVPGDYKKSPDWNGEAKRVFCEDLGSTDDFDFNDIVLDVVTIDGWPAAKTIITLRAAGGTLPAYIKVGSEELGEVHELFGVAQNTMVNTRTKGAVERPIVVLEVNGKYTAGDVQIIVENTEGIKYELNAAKGSIPYKFATPIGVDWTDEREQIETKYPNFKNWVADENNYFWE